MQTVKAPETEDTKPKCGDCYGAKLNETHCCNTCQDVIDAYREKRWNPNTEQFKQCQDEKYVDKESLAKTLALNEGCQIYGHMEVNRVILLNIKTKKKNKNFHITLKQYFISADGRKFPRGTWKKLFYKPYSYT